jgi:putative peptide zinc metalloprotease protein
LYRRSSGTVVSELDTLLPGQFLLVSSGRKHYQLSGLARAVVLCMGEDALPAEEIQKRVESQGLDCSGRLSETLGRLVDLSILSSPEIAPPVRRRWSSALLHRYLTLKLDLLSADRLAPVTGVLSVLFASASMRYLMPVLLALQIAFCWTFFGTAVASVPKLSGAQLAWLVAGNYAALLMHELGHASACAAGRIRHGPIGFCIYLIYPAFYADVSESWKLPRSRRAVVDAGGMYMSLLCASVACAAFFITREPVSRLLAILCDITVFWNLNPFIRMDGYWLMSDLLGVQNLMSVNRNVSWWLLRRVLSRKDPAPSILSPDYRFRSVYFAYYCAFLIFFGYASVQLGGHYLPELVRAYPGLTANLAGSFQRFREIGSMLKALFYWLLGTLSLVWILLLLVRWTIALFRAIRRWAFL